MQVETVLKGDVPFGDGTFFYISTNGPAGAKGMGYFGTFRALLLLRREREELRTVTDISAGCDAGVFSGAHPGVRPDPRVPLKQTVVDLLLTRGEDATDNGMIRAIFDGAPSKISPEYTARNLLRLAESEKSSVVRAAACLSFRKVLIERLQANEKESALSQASGIAEADVMCWRKQYEQEDTREWWFLTFLAGRNGKYRPSLTQEASALSGLALCNNDKALGIPQVRENAPAGNR